jgi:hypothetical protein
MKTYWGVDVQIHVFLTSALVGGGFQGVKWQGHEDDHSHLSSVERMRGAILMLLPYVFIV